MPIFTTIGTALVGALGIAGTAGTFLPTVTLQTLGSTK